jgi:signal peptidase I
MEPTLLIDDRMAVEKLSYLVREPRRGEIVVFEGEDVDVADDGTVARVVRGAGQFLGIVPANARDYVKRVIGLPGDVVEVRRGTVYVDGVALDEPYVVYEDLSDFGPVTVPVGSIFFLGDNRPNSADSRSALGFVAREAVVGRAVVIIWPLSRAGGFDAVDHDAALEGR